MSHTRREFLQGIAATAAAVSAVPNAVDAEQSSAPARSIDEIFARGVIVDDLGGFRPNPKLPNNGWDFLAASGLTICTAGVGSVVPHESIDSTVDGLARFAASVARNSDRMVQVRTFGDIERARREKKLALIPNVQNSTCIGSELKNLDRFYQLGLRQIQLTFNWRNWVGDGCTERTQAGLSYFGADLVKRMNELGMIVDVGHTGYQSTLDAVELSAKPIVFSHTNCKALCDHPRNKTDDQIRALAKKDGVMGLTCFNWFVSDKPRSTLADLLDHFDHVIKLVGPDHVGIGSDFDGISETVVGLEDVSKFPALFEELARRGWSQSDLEKLAGGNILRVLHEAEVVSARLKRERQPSNATIEALDRRPVP